jgi:hypothetical protein
MTLFMVDHLALEASAINCKAGLHGSHDEDIHFIDIKQAATLFPNG